MPKPIEPEIGSPPRVASPCAASSAARSAFANARAGRDAEALRDGPDRASGCLARLQHRRPRLQHRAPEEPACTGTHEQRRDEVRPRRLTEHGHAARIAAEGADLVTHPFEGGDDVEQSAVVRRVVEGAETLDAEAVVDRHEHDAVAREGRAVVHGLARRPVAERPAVHPHHDRKPRLGRIELARRARPDVEVEAVVAGDRRVVEQVRKRCRVRHLGGSRPVLQRVAHALPRLDGRGCGEPERAEGRRRVRDSAIACDAVDEVAAHRAGPCVGEGRGHRSDVRTLRAPSPSSAAESEAESESEASTMRSAISTCASAT